MATWLSPCGAWPDFRRSGLSSGCVGYENARVGGPEPPIGLPLLSSIWANPETEPSATATPGTWRALSTGDARTSPPLNVGPRFPPWSAARADTTQSMLALGRRPGREPGPHVQRR